MDLSDVLGWLLQPINWESMSHLNLTLDAHNFPLHGLAVYFGLVVDSRREGEMWGPVF
tara:strand:- start:207 stop:380 length:174 start_codon:yes stop_codon:yes gene_type:complete